MDPRLTIQYGLGETKMTIPALQLKASAAGGKLNLCPCGCDEKDLNEHGYCKHLVGFTVEGKVIELREANPAPAILERTGFKTEPVREDDILVPITSTSRVYRGKRVVRLSEQDQAAKAQQEQIEELQKQVAALLELQKNGVAKPLRKKPGRKPKIKTEEAQFVSLQEA